MKNEQTIWYAFQLTNHWNRRIPFNEVYQKKLQVSMYECTEHDDMTVLMLYAVRIQHNKYLTSSQSF